MTSGEFLWVVEFPLFEKDEEAGRWAAVHHPITSPVPEDIALMDTDPGTVRSRAYDCVLNGNEVGGGSIRIHDPAVQEKVFSCLSFTREDARARFGFLLDALASGTPGPRRHSPRPGQVGPCFSAETVLSAYGMFMAFPKTQESPVPHVGGPFSGVSPNSLMNSGSALLQQEKKIRKHPRALPYRGSPRAYKGGR